MLRAVLGAAAAAACVPSSMALITRLHPEPTGRTRAVSVWAAVSGAALAAGRRPRREAAAPGLVPARR